MKKLLLVGLSGLLSPLTHGADVELPRSLDRDGFQEVLAVSGDVYISGQPDEAGLARAKSLGVTTVVNLRTHRETDNRNIVPYDEQAGVAALGMRYVHIPQGGPDTPYHPAAVDRFAQAVEAAEGKVLLHCTVAWRASHLWAAYLVKYKGLDLKEAVRHGRAVNFGTLPLEGFLDESLTMDYQVDR
ncbi:MAG: protein tyrosine phosphatase family protein [Gammaproteobacteria bacterium]|nr:protein tyrosine phosphatase family protein [Gammaproteobacteria bacterium]MCZ6854688.1 protein tyrosine phosphatase family protein [Gammaproteobacteria bacterium]